jgi:branched-chain amino acid aminotransferase
MVEKTDFIWMDGEFTPWEQANVHILTHTLHYGLGAFEGIRCYKQADGSLGVFRLREHIDRIFDTCKIIMLDIPFSPDDLVEACLETVRRNGLEDCYIRPLVYMGDGAMGLGASNRTRVSIVAFPWGAYLGEDGIENGIRCAVSSFTRLHVNINMVRAKVCGQYTNSILAKRLAMLQGVDETILLDSQGYVSEGSGENLFVLRKGIVKTAPTSSPILEGLTRDCAIRICRDLGHVVNEIKFTRDELYTADEVFLTGTAAEVTPVREVDFRPVGTGKPGPLTKEVQKRYFMAIRGEIDEYSHWIEKV